MPKAKSKIRKEVDKMEKEIAPTITLDKPFHVSPTTFGQKASDWVTKWIGSWTFIILLAIVMIGWIAVNTTWLLFGQEWDPYPFILLNFVLSTLAAVQAPIILMSQNREAQKDRARADYDYRVNKKAEKEIRQIQTQLVRIERRLHKK
jgi:uncharacterized membrane protein